MASLPDAVVVIDGEARIAWANVAAERLIGATVGSWWGRSALDIVHPDDVHLALASMESVQGKEVGSPIELRVVTATGWRLVEVIGVPLGPDLDGGVVLCMRDMSERRRWEIANDEVAKFRAVLQYAPSISMLVGPDGTVESTSGAVTRLLGHDQERIQGRPLADLAVPEDRDDLIEALAAGLARPAHLGEAAVTVEVELRHGRGGTPVPVSLSIVNLLDDPSVGGLVVSGHDATSTKQAERDLRNALSLLEATLDATADGILVVGLDGRITSFNSRFREMWRVPAALLVSGDDDAVIDHVVGQLRDPRAFRAKIHALYAQPELDDHDTLQFNDGRTFERHSTPQRVDGAVAGRVWSFRDVTGRLQLEEQLAHQAFHDSLTDLANQALFRDRVGHALDRMERGTGRMAVAFLDLDDFKTINDSLGHTVGDGVLVQVGRRLLSCLRPGDTAARMGGDEFAVLLEDIDDRDQVVALAERVLAVLRPPFDVGAKLVSVGCSIGIALDAPGDDGEHLLRNADLAMYTAKRLGKGRVEVFEEEMHTAALERLELEADLRGASLADELVIHFQPIVDLRSGTVVGTEALVRWDHPRRGLLAPDVFIPTAEAIGVIDAIGEHVMREACAQTRRWQVDDGLVGLTVNVNLSPRQLRQGALPAQVEAALRASGLPPGDLVLEITEGAVMHDPVDGRAKLVALTSLGIKLAIDDFGTGYSSLSHLQRFPLDVLKIDASFVRDLDGGPGGSTLALTIVRLAQSLGLLTIAEGVETAAQAQALEAMGCFHAQGFHLGHPQTADGLRPLLLRAAA